MPSYQSPFVFLPIELVLDILRVAAYSSHKTALLLTLVNTWVKKATARCLYETVVLRSRSQVMGFLRTVALAGGWNSDEHMWAVDRGDDVAHEENRPEPILKDRWCVNPAPYVKNMCITYHNPGAGPRDFCGIVFNMCPNLTRISLQSTFLHSSLVPDHPVQNVKCKELNVLGPTFPSDWEKHASVLVNGGLQEFQNAGELEGGLPRVLSSGSVLQHITHLRLFGSLSSPQFSALHLKQLPALTHLALLIREHVYNPENPFRDLDHLLPPTAPPFVDTDPSPETLGSLDILHGSRAQLQMIIISLDKRMLTNNGRNLDEWASMAQLRDPRLFVVSLIDDYDRPDSGESQSPISRCERLRRVVSGLEDIWSRARTEQDERDRKMAKMQAQLYSGFEQLTI